MQLQGHPDGRGDDFVQQVHVGEHPLVLSGHPEVAFEEGVEAVQERVQAEKQSPVPFCPADQRRRNPVAPSPSLPPVMSPVTSVSLY